MTGPSAPAGGGESDGVTYEGRPTTMEAKRELSEFLAGRVPGDTLQLEFADGKTRTISIERQCQAFDDTPDWTGMCLCEEEIGYVGTGHGTEYLLTVQTGAQPMLPRLGYPSNAQCSALVMRARIAEQGDPIQSERTADDLFWRVDRYDGR